MAKVLTANQVEAYREKGYHFPVDVLSPAEVAAFRSELENYERQSGGPISGAARHRSHLLFTWVNNTGPPPEDPGRCRGRFRPEPFLLDYEFLP